jgi:hypothetical protein
MKFHLVSKVFRLTISLFGGMLGVAALLFFLGRQDVFNVRAEPIPPLLVTQNCVSLSRW